MISKKGSKIKVVDRRYWPIRWHLHGRVNRSMIEHLSVVKAHRIQREGSIVLGVETKLETFLLVHLVH